MSLTRKREEDAEVSRALEKFEKSMTKHAELKEYKLKEAQRKAEEHISYVMSKLEKVKNKGEMSEEEVKFRMNMEKSIKRKLDVNKERERLLKFKKRDKYEKLRQEQEKAKMILKQNEREMHERNKYIMKRVKERDHVISEKRKMLDTEAMQRREQQRLRRENQMFNYKREIAIKNDYKAQLMDKIMEKAQKAQRAKERSKTAGVPSALNLTAM